MSFKDSEAYNKIKNSNETLHVAYHIGTNIIINEENIKYILDVEKQKLSNTNLNVEKILENYYNSKIGKEYMKIEFISLNKDNIEIYKDIEKNSNFRNWLV